MRVVERKMINAVRNEAGMKCGNTIVCGGVVYLHGHAIAKFSADGLFISDCGWQTATTKSRLNAILDAFNCGRIYQRDHVWYHNGVVWNGSVFIPRRWFNANYCGSV